MTLPTAGRAADVENPHAGEGPVLLDIGGDVGALVVRMPPGTVGDEVEIRPVSSTPGAGAHRHVAVVARPVASGVAHTLVYEGLEAGRYELHALPEGPVTLTVDVAGGEVTRANWPTGAPPAPVTPP
ncbi:hypothetical protein [Intrasporangium flavum]|uniref:hypothetical protein n=1 Tax=Intrasporangium flavum TaxID=1428657 RepID=UPI00096FFDB4|nr:hypothetical protein [Intrasporangium flavum]